MRLQSIEYLCANGHRFAANGLGESSYGEFILWSSAGNARYLNGIEDPTYDEVDAILSELAEVSGKTALERASILQEIFGAVACDRDVDGSTFEMCSFPKCPNCGTQQMSSWRFGAHPDFAEVRILPVSHEVWRNLSQALKVGRVRSIVAQKRSP